MPRGLESQAVRQKTEEIANARSERLPRKIQLIGPAVTMFIVTGFGFALFPRPRANDVCHGPISLKKPILNVAWCVAGVLPDAATEARRVSGCRDRLWHRDQLGQFPEVLGGGGEEELAAGADQNR